MLPTKLIIEADSPEEAKRKAAAEFDAEPDNIIVEAAGKGRFKAVPQRLDARVDIAVSDDCLEASVAEIAEPIGDGSALTLKIFGYALKNAGVRVDPDIPAIKKALADHKEGKDVTGRVLARGRAPQPAQDAYLDPIGDWRYPVFPGDAFGNLVPAKEAQPGLCVDGSTISPPGERRGKSLEFPEKCYAYIDRTTTEVRAELYGIVNVEGSTIQIEPLLEISGDAMRVIGTVYPNDYRGKPITLERVQAALEAEEVTERVYGKEVGKAIKESDATGRKVREVTFCKGVKPQDGMDGWFEMSFADERSGVGEETEDGRVDFRSRGVVRSVKPGEILGRLNPPHPGIPGRDVYGRIIPATDGEDLVLTLDEGVDPGPETNTYVAAREGMVFFLNNTLSVTDVFQTRGDVNMTTGNIELEKGSAHIRGAILSGFSVSCPCNVVVDDLIESAQVTAGGDVEVRGGIIMEREGHILAEGGVSALHAKNAVITAQGSVVIAHEATNCTIYAGQKVIATKGRGKIVGGIIRAAQGIEANEIGSELGVETAIFLGQEVRTDPELIQRKSHLEKMLQKIYAAIGTADPKTILMQALPEKRVAIAEILKKRLACEQGIRDIEAKIQAQRISMRESTRAKVKVMKTVWPGTVINCFGAAHVVKEPTQYSQFYYDHEQGRIVVGSL